MKKTEMNNNEREIFYHNIRLLYKETPLQKSGFYDAKKMWENYTRSTEFPIKGTNYHSIFRTSSIENITVTTAVKAIKMINPYLDIPYTGNTDGECFEKFIEYKFTTDNFPSIRIGNIEKKHKKFIQDYYVYMPTEKPHVLELGILSLYMNSVGEVTAYLLSQFRNMNELFKKNKIWNVFSDFNAENIKKRFESTYVPQNGGQPICKLFISDSVEFTNKQMIISFSSISLPHCKSLLFLDISDCVTPETPHDLLYQFGCGAISTWSSAGFKSSHILLVTATRNKNEQENNLFEKRSEHFPSCLLDPIGISHIEKAIEYGNLSGFSCNSRHSGDFYLWNKAMDTEETRKEDTSLITSKKDLSILIKKLQKIYDNMEDNG